MFYVTSRLTGRVAAAIYCRLASTILLSGEYRVLLAPGLHGAGQMMLGYTPPFAMAWRKSDRGDEERLRDAGRSISTCTC